MKKKMHFLRMTKVKFAVTVNLLLVFIILHNVVSGIFRIEEALFFTLFLVTFVYFVALSAYSLYMDVIQK